MQSFYSPRSVLGPLFLFFALTPWTHWGLNSMDSQPWPLVFGILYLIFAKPLSTNKAIVGISVIVVVTLPVLLALQWPGEAPALRAIGSYLTLIVCSAAYYDYIQNHKPPIRLIYGVNSLWLIIGFAQLYVPDIASLVSESRTSDGRGVTSMAPEPTFFAIYLIFSTWLILLSENYKISKISYIFVVLNCASIVFLCKSSMGFLFLIIAATTYIFYQFINLKKSAFITALMLFVFMISLTQIGLAFSILGSRMTGMMATAQDNDILSMFYKDESMNFRMEHLVFSFDGLIRNYFLPGGFDSFLFHRNNQLNYYDGFFWSLESADKIMSFYGAIAYELGVFGLLVIGIMIRSIARSKSLLGYFELLIFSLFSLAAIPVAFAPLHLVLAALIHRNRTSNLGER